MMAATLLGFTGMVLRAQEPEFLSSPSWWDTVTTLGAGGGFKDNVFLSHAQPRGAAFASAEGEFMAFRAAPTGPQFSFFGSGDARHFFTGEDGHNEYTAFTQAQLEQDLSDQLKASLGALYFYQNQVIDVSASEDVREALPAVGHTLTTRPALRLALPGRHWLTLEGTATRQFYRSPLDNYWEGGPKLILGRAYGPKSELAISYETLWRFYDTEPARTSAGDPIPASHRNRLRHEVRVNWRHSWDQQNHWRTVVAAAGQFADENGGGYFDYSRWLTSCRLEYRAKAWRLSIDGRMTQYFYANQTATASSNSLRERTELTLGGRIERPLGRGFRLAGAYEYEQTFSNDPIETYRANTVSGMLEWEF